MTLTIDLSDDLENRLRSAAKARGTDEAETARHLLEHALPALPQPGRLTREEHEALLATLEAEEAAKSAEELAEEDAAYDAMLRRLEGESRLSLRRVDVSDFE